MLDEAFSRCLRRRFIPVRTVAYSEIDTYAASLLVERMEDAFLDSAPVWDDFKSFPTKFFARRLRKNFRAVVAGIPCQPHSKSGRRLQADDPRDLWPQFRKFIKRFRPHAIFFENVSAIAHRCPAPQAYIFRILRDLAELGFDAEWEIVHASSPEIGASTPRQRLFLLAFTPLFANQLHTQSCSPDAQRMVHPDSKTFQMQPDHARKNRTLLVRPRQLGCPSYPLPRLAPGPLDPLWARILEDSPHLVPALPVPESREEAARLQSLFRSIPSGLASVLANRQNSLRMVGNGVCLQQAEYALTKMLARV